MKITIVAVGLRQPAWADSAVEDYLGRFPKDWAVSVKAVKPELRSGQSTANIMKTEAERIRAAIPHNSLIIAMDERGKDLTTVDLAKKILERCGRVALFSHRRRRWSRSGTQGSGPNAHETVIHDSASRDGASDVGRTNLSRFQHPNQPPLPQSLIL